MNTNTSEDGSDIKIISPTTHSVLDYAAVVILVIAPSLFGLTGALAYGAYGLAAVYFILAVTTKFAGGMFSVLSFRTHGVIELLVALGMVVSPWILGFSDVTAARNFFFGFGILAFIVWILTQYQPLTTKSEEQPGQPDEDTSENIDGQTEGEGSISQNGDDINNDEPNI